jgi:hypothetical protein
LETRLFINYEKAFHNTHRYFLSVIVKSRNIPDTLLEVIVAMHTQKILTQLVLQIPNRAENKIALN